MAFERPNIRIRYRRFSFDIEGKTYDIVPDLIYDIGYINLTSHHEHTGPLLQRHGISDNNYNEDRQMDDGYLSDYKDQLLEDFSLSQAKGPISKFLVGMPGTMDSAFAIDAG